jgi:putative colanic acid biosynthesis acetyltransferase WcaF
MNEIAAVVHPIESRTASPWPFKERLMILLWSFAWALLCCWTPKPLNAWRLFWLKLFGCKIQGTPFVHQRARIEMPWHITLHDKSCVGDRANLYALGEIELGSNCVVAQEAYLCTGTHDFNDPHLALVTAKITVGSDVFVGARAFVLAGVQIGDGAIVGACSLVTHNVEPWSVVAGSPARFLRLRTRPNSETL